MLLRHIPTQVGLSVLAQPVPTQVGRLSWKRWWPDQQRSKLVQFVEVLSSHPRMQLPNSPPLQASMR
jgi:hypothetical protein